MTKMGDTLGVTYLFRFHSSLKWTVSRFIQALIQHREPAGFEKNEQSRAGSLRAIEHQQNLNPAGSASAKKNRYTSR